MKDIRLVDVGHDNWEDICCLYPGKEGVKFVASNSFSIAQSVFEKGWITKGIVIEDLFIGFTMYGFTQEFGFDAYELCRFMIDRKYQGNGYGKQALRVIINEMFGRYGCEKIYLSTMPSNARGIHIYEGAGFVSTGKMCGDGDDEEEIYCLSR